MADLYDELESLLANAKCVKCGEPIRSEKPCVDESDLPAFDPEWQGEIAREEGMLNGIDSFNDWSQ